MILSLGNYMVNRFSVPGRAVFAPYLRILD
jgi:hypothetical protein